MQQLQPETSPLQPQPSKRSRRGVVWGGARRSCTKTETEQLCTANGLLVYQNPPPPAESWKLYPFRTLTLDRFIAAHVDGDLQQLVESGAPDAGALAAHWEEIQGEYSKAMGSGDEAARLSLVGRVEALNLQFDEAVKLFATWIDVPTDDASEALRLAGFERDFTPASWEADRNYCRARLQSLWAELEMLRAQLEPLQQSEGNEPMTYNRYMDTVAVLSKEGYRVELTTTTMPVFCAMIRQHNRTVEQYKKAASNGEPSGS